MAKQDDADVDQLYRASYARLVASVCHIGTCGRQEAEEAVQEAFLKLLALRGRQSLDRPDAWVRKVALDLVSNRKRKVRNGLAALRRAVPVPDVPGTDIGPAVDVARALQRISADQRESLVLHYYLDHSVDMIAEDLGVPIGTVKARLARGRRAVEALLGEDSSHAV